ncbi:MAG TPA: hypothetical protein PLO61_01140 [Fimbriimonadaceae bacterium]|nr:hypothetical protein [Fimbriimonadaceae bacterium]HRJ33754.1 hypothetical protein [Fimbriimonadaceae bacterium]
MPFEPLRTDEPTPGGRKPTDMDNVMLAGCTTFVVASLLAYGLGVLPFLVMQDTYRLIVLKVSVLVGLVPVLGLAVLATRRFGLPAATGVLAGSMATGIFLYLRFDQIMLGFVVREIPNPEYPTVFGWLIPVAWVLSVLLAILLSLRSAHFLGAAPPKP